MGNRPPGDCIGESRQATGYSITREHGSGGRVGKYRKWDEFDGGKFAKPCCEVQNAGIVFLQAFTEPAA